MSGDVSPSGQAIAGLEFWLKVARNSEAAIAFFVEDSDCRVDHSGGTDFVGPFHLTDAFGEHRQIFIRLGAMEAVRARLDAALPHGDIRPTVAPESEQEEEVAWTKAMLGGSAAYGEGAEPVLPRRPDVISLPRYRSEGDDESR